MNEKNELTELIKDADTAFAICQKCVDDLNCEVDFDFAAVLNQIAERELALHYLATHDCDIELDPRHVALLPHIAKLLSTAADLMNLSGKYDLWDI